MVDGRHWFRCCTKHKETIGPSVTYNKEGVGCANRTGKLTPLARRELLHRDGDAAAQARRRSGLIPVDDGSFQCRR